MNDKTSALDKFESKKRDYVAKAWMDDVAKQIIEVVTLINQEREVYGTAHPKDFMLYDILNTAFEELLVHYSIDKKTGELIAHTLGPV